MNPIFSYVDPVLLFKKIPPYDYLLFILYKHANSAFADSFRQSMGRYHVASGKNIGLFVFDFPNDRWFRDNFQYFLQRYKNSSTHEDWLFILDDVSQSTYKRTQRLKEWLRNTDDHTFQYMDRFMNLFSLDDSKLPALLVFMKAHPAAYYLKSNIGIGHIDDLLCSLSGQKNIPHDDLYELPASLTLPQIVDKLNNDLSSEYWEIVESIHCLQLQRDKSREPIKGLIKRFPAFSALRHPDCFEWHKDLIKWLTRYNNLVDRFVHQLNTLIENPSKHGLGLERIRNFWRFRVSDKYRGHFFERNGKKVCYFLGYHDYQL